MDSAVTALLLKKVGHEVSVVFMKNFSSRDNTNHECPWKTDRDEAYAVAKHLDIPIETWDVHEFIYLDPKIYSGTTAEQRFESVKKYWNEASVHYKEADGSESFSEMTKRIAKLINDLKERPEKIITIFSHARFIQAIKLYIEKVKELGRYNLTDEELNELKEIHREEIVGRKKFPIENASVHKIEI